MTKNRIDVHLLTDLWAANRKRRELRERQKASTLPPLARLPGRRRRMALLFHIMTEDNEAKASFVVNVIGGVPLTRDMRWLLDRGYLKAGRDAHFAGKRVTSLHPTEAGRAALLASAPNESDLDWVRRARIFNMLS